MTASLALHPAEKPRNRSIEARRAARRAKFERERLIVDSLNRGVPVVEIAGRIGVTEKRMRALVKEILARRMPAAPEDYAALQASRLNEALLVAYGAMSPENLKAVALVVRIVRELDRYHGFAAARCSDAHRSPACVTGPPPRAAGDCARKWRRKRLKRRNLRPKKSRSRTRSTRRRSKLKTLAPRRRATWEWKRRTTPRRRPPNRRSPTRRPPGPAPARKWRRKRLKTLILRPETGPRPPPSRPKSRPRTGTPSRPAPPRRRKPRRRRSSPQPTEWPESTAVVLAPDPAAPGGFRRMRIRFLRNGVAACADAA